MEFLRCVKTKSKQNKKKNLSLKKKVKQIMSRSRGNGNNTSGSFTIGRSARGRSSSVERSTNSALRSNSTNRAVRSENAEIRGRTLSLQPRSVIRANNAAGAADRAHSPNFRLDDTRKGGSFEHRNYPYGSWRGDRFYREQGFFVYGPSFWVGRPWFLNFYNFYYPLPLFPLPLFAPIIIAPTVDTYSQDNLQAYIAQQEATERAAGRAPSDPNARLVPSFATSPPTLMWATPNEE
jgi:hypothetical protein